MFAQWLSTHARCNRNLSCDGGIVCDLCATLPEKPCDPETQARSAPNRQPHAGLRQCGRKMLSHALSLAQKWSAPPRTADGGAGDATTSQRIMVALQTVRSLFAFTQLRRDGMPEMSL